jgi:hypothetical protein
MVNPSANLTYEPRELSADSIVLLQTLHTNHREHSATGCGEQIGSGSVSERSLTEFTLNEVEGFEMTDPLFVVIPSGSEESFPVGLIASEL